MAAACLSSPPAACRPSSLSPAYRSPAKSGVLALPQGDVRVHAAAVVLEDRLGHERDGLAVTLRDVLADVLVPHELIGHLQQRGVVHVDLALPGGGHLVMVRFDDDADLAHLVDHLPAEIVVGVGRADRKVPALEAGFVTEVRLLDARRVPRAFDRVDLVIPRVLVLLVAHLVEDEELGLGPDVARVGDARLAQMRLGLARDMTRVARVVLARHRVDDVGDDADRRPGEERIEAGRVGVRARPSCPTRECPAIREWTTRRTPALPRTSPRPRFRSGRSNAATYPSMSTNFRSTISAWCFFARVKKSAAFMRVPSGSY